MKFITNTSQTFPAVANQSYTVWAQGTFGGGSLALEFSLDGITWGAATDSNGAVALTAAGGVEFTAPTRQGRLRLSGATAPDITAEVFA